MGLYILHNFDHSSWYKEEWQRNLMKCDNYGHSNIICVLNDDLCLWDTDLCRYKLSFFNPMLHPYSKRIDIFNALNNRYIDAYYCENL